MAAAEQDDSLETTFTSRRTRCILLLTAPRHIQQTTKCIFNGEANVFRRVLPAVVLALLNIGCLGHLAPLEASDIHPHYPKNSTEEQKQLDAKWWRCKAYDNFYQETEGKLRTSNTAISVASGLLALTSATAGGFAGGSDDKTARQRLAVVSVSTGVLSVIAAAIRLYSYTDDHGYVRGRYHEMDQLLLEDKPSADQVKKCFSIVDDKKLPEPDYDEKRRLEKALTAKFDVVIPGMK